MTTLKMTTLICPNKVKSVKRRRRLLTGLDANQPGDFVYIDVEREEQARREREKIVIQNHYEMDAAEEQRITFDIDSAADALRDSMLNTLGNIAGYDKASGQVEAVARDFLESDVETDSSVHVVAQSVARLDVLCLLAQRTLNVPPEIKQEYMLNAARILTQVLPEQIHEAGKVQRHKQLFDNMRAVSKRVGSESGPYGNPTPIGVRA